VSVFHPLWLDGTPTPEARNATLGDTLPGVLAEYVLLSEAGALTYPEYLTPGAGLDAAHCCRDGLGIPFRPRTSAARRDGAGSGEWESVALWPATGASARTLFRDAERVVLVDTGAGDFFGPGYGGKLLESLASIHVSPNQVTDVLLTHAHDDHMGGLVHNGQLVFPHAIVHLSAPDLAFFMDRSNSAKAHYAMSYFDRAYTALKPEEDAGKLVTFHSGEEVLPGVEAVIHPGHTPGSTFYILRSHVQTIIFVGDMIHVAAVQAPDPKITIAYDVDPAKAAAVRETAFAEFARDRTLIAVPHLSFPGVGHIKTSGDGFTWVPIPYENRDFSKDATFLDPHKNGDKP